MTRASNNSGDAEARRLFQTEFRRTFLVEAGAGTGKTTLLVGRLLSALARGVTDAPGLVAITFTERAAAELQVRIRQALETVVTSGVRALPDHAREAFEGLDPTDPKVVERLRNALHDLDRAHISTIHAFCFEMLVTRPLEARVDPEGSGLDNEALRKRLEEEIAECWLAGQVEGDHTVQGLVDLGYRSDDVAEIAKALFEQVDLLPHMNLKPERFSAGPFREELRRGKKALEDFIRRYSVKPGATRTDLERCLEVLDAVLARRGEEALKTHLLTDSAWDEVSFRRPAKTQWDGGVERGKEAVDLAKDLLAVIEEGVRRIHAPAFCAGIAWLRDRVTDVRGKLRRNGLLGFSDLLLLARDLLRDHRDVRRFFQKRFRLILVDEFQDTDPLQAEIAFFLAEGEARAAAWTDCRLEPGKLCLVADPKQSIYRFRRADIQTYLFVKGLVEKLPHGETLRITKNFRSVPAVIDWVNSVFPALIREVPGRGVQPPYTALEKHRSARPVKGSVFLYGEGLGGTVGAVRELEQDLISEIVASLHGNPDFPVLDRRTGKSRPPRYADMGVLFPKRTGYASAEERLADRGIPFVSDVGPAFYAREEIQELCSVLQAVENPHDPVALYAALHSPLFGYSDDDLARLSAEGPIHLFRPASTVPERFRESFGLLQTLHKERNRRGVARTVRDLLDGTRAWEFFGESDRYGPRKVAHLEGLVARAARSDVQGRWSFAEFVEEFRTLCEEGHAEEGELPITFGGDDVVSLLTIHQAKGLEFPIVILANLCSGLAFEGDVPAETLVTRVPGPALVLRCGENHTPGFPETEEREEELEAAEKARQLYVAATRARDYLFVTRAGNLSPATFGGLLAAGGRGKARDFDPEAVADRAGAKRKPRRKKFDRKILSERKKWVRERGKLLEDRDVAFPVLHPSLAKAKEREGMTADDDGAEPASPAKVEPERESPEAEEDARRQAMAFGTAFHRIMAALDLEDAREASGPGALSKANEVLVERAASEEGLPVSAVPELLDALEKTAASDVFQRALKADLVLRETPVLYPDDQDQRVQGDIDLLFREKDAWSVVDYKTDRVPGGKTAGDAAEPYRGQIDAYVSGVQRATGAEVRGLVLLARTGESVVF
ncbi:MAG: UvrD-helicase domain-containing protein [Planctomycetota bacterium]|jgi:ATP-dependent helicase/nuclease subunit A